MSSLHISAVIANTMDEKMAILAPKLKSRKGGLLCRLPNVKSC